MTSLNKGGGPALPLAITLRFYAVMLKPPIQVEPAIDVDQMVAALMRERCRFLLHFSDVADGRSESSLIGLQFEKWNYAPSRGY